MLWVKFIPINDHIKKQEIFQINNLTLQLKKEQTNPKASSRRKEIVKIRAERNEIEKRKTIEKISETKGWFFEKNQQTFS